MMALFLCRHGARKQDSLALQVLKKYYSSSSNNNSITIQVVITI